MGWQERPAIKLSRTEIRVLKRLARQYSAPFRDVVRARVVLLAAEGLRTGEIARRVGVPRQIALKWITRFAAERIVGLTDRLRTGRPGRNGAGRGCELEDVDPERRRT